MAECTQKQQHPITRQTGWPAGTPVHHLCECVCACDSGKHTETGGSGGLVSTCPPVITQEAMKGEKKSERKMRKTDEEQGGGRVGGSLLQGREGGFKKR